MISRTTLLSAFLVGSIASPYQILSAQDEASTLVRGQSVEREIAEGESRNLVHK